MQNIFPQLTDSHFKLTSPRTIEYNCIAWAADDTETWWWPDMFEQYYWPSEVLREESIEAFIKAFEYLGYTTCENDSYETGFEKIVIYTTVNGKPSHAAKQIDENIWSSKIGRLEDIEHSINSLTGDAYGEPKVFMRRSKK